MLRRVKKNGLTLTKTSKLTSSSMPTKGLLKKLIKKTGKKVLSTHDDLVPLLQAPEYDEEVTEKVLSPVGRNKHRKSKKEKQLKQKKCRTTEVLNPNLDGSQHEGKSDSDQEEPTEKRKLLRRQQKQKRVKEKRKSKKRVAPSEDRVPLLQSTSGSSDEGDGEGDFDEQLPKIKKLKVVEVAVDGDSSPDGVESEQSVGAGQKRKGNRKAKLNAGRIDERLWKRREARRLRRQKAKVLVININIVIVSTPNSFFLHTYSVKMQCLKLYVHVYRLYQEFLK